MTFLLEVKIARAGNTILIDDQWSVTFHSRDKDKTFNAIIQKCAELEKSLVEGSQELTDLRDNIELQLTSIYKEYEASKPVNNKDKASLPDVQPAESPKLDITSMDWQQKLEEKRNCLIKATDLIPNLWHSLEFVLSVKTILNIQDITLPFAGIVLGAPSSNKTVGIEMFRKWPQTFYTDKFTAKSFVSHSTGVPKEELTEIDLLPKIKNKFLLTPELGPLFAARDDDLVENLGILTRVLDGHGYESDSGAHGHRGYNGEFMFVQVGAAVDIPHKVYKYLGTLGPKLYFLRVPKSKKGSDEYYQQLKNNDFGIRRAAIEAALIDYLKWFEASPAMEHRKGLPKLACDATRDDDKAMKNIVELAKLLAHLRGVVPTWETKDPQSQGSQYAYSMAIIEEPDRAMQQLYNLARGRALSCGRNYIIKEDLALVVKVVLSTAMTERVKVFDLLVNHGGTLTTTDVTRGLNTTSPTARRTMTEFKALGLVLMEEITDDQNNRIYRVTLKSDFHWFLAEEFRDLRKGFELAEEETPVVERKSPPTNPPDPKESLFKEICRQLSKDNEGKIEHKVLHGNLVSSGKFDAGPATAAIDRALKEGYLELVETGVYRTKEIEG